MGWILREAEVRYRPGTRVVDQRRIASSNDCAALVRSEAMGRINDAAEEHFLVIAVNAKNQVIGWSQVAKGGTTYCIVEPAAVFRTLLLMGAVGFVAVHNHPSGDPAPSAEDVALTDRLRRASDLIGVRLLDHVIVGGPDAHFSFLDSGLLGAS